MILGNRASNTLVNWGFGLGDDQVKTQKKTNKKELEDRKIVIFCYVKSVTPITCLSEEDK